MGVILLALVIIASVLAIASGIWVAVALIRAIYMKPAEQNSRQAEKSR